MSLSSRWFWFKNLERTVNGKAVFVKRVIVCAVDKKEANRLLGVELSKLSDDEENNYCYFPAQLHGPYDTQSMAHRARVD